MSPGPPLQCCQSPEFRVLKWTQPRHRVRLRHRPDPAGTQQQCGQAQGTTPGQPRSSQRTLVPAAPSHFWSPPTTPAAVPQYPGLGPVLLEKGQGIPRGWGGPRGRAALSLHRAALSGDNGPLFPLTALRGSASKQRHKMGTEDNCRGPPGAVWVSGCPQEHLKEAAAKVPLSAAGDLAQVPLPEQEAQTARPWRALQRAGGPSSLQCHPPAHPSATPQLTPAVLTPAVLTGSSCSG